MYFSHNEGCRMPSLSLDSVAVHTHTYFLRSSLRHSYFYELRVLNRCTAALGMFAFRNERASV